MEQVTEETKKADLWDFGWKALLRFDQYIAATNAKAGFILALDGGVFTLTANWLSICPTRFASESNYWWPTATALLVLATCATILTTLFVVSPNLKSPRNSHVGNSSIFFGDFSGRTHAEFVKSTSASSFDHLRDDLLIQVHTVGSILDQKFRLMRWSFRILIYCQVPLMLGMSSLKILA